ncbi:MAG: hypothetical protein LBH25_03070 [Fibromonadaceae bacterium]|jgi:hypothetical protein|nr:hypothetical protein [Fibromonadaceae bacterium]
MKYFSGSVIILFFAGFVNAQPIIKIQSHVQSYLQEKSGKHRSGLLSAKDYSSNYEELREGESVQLLYEKESFLEIKNIASKGIDKNFRYINYNDNIVYLDSCKNSFKVDVDNLKKKQYQESKKLLKQFFPDSIAKQFDLFVIGTEYTASKAIPQTVEYSYEKYMEGKKSPQADSKIDSPIKKSENGYALLFQRIYKGRVIRNFDNHLNITIDKDGYVKNMEIAWQDLLPAGEFADVSNNSAKIAQALEMVTKLNHSSMSKIGESKADTLAVKNFDVNGVAKAWCKITLDSKNVLFPCLSYSGNVELSNGETVPTIIDAPYSIDYKIKPLMLGGKP